jgi:hypothetical protein
MCTDHTRTRARYVIRGTVPAASGADLFVPSAGTYSKRHLKAGTMLSGSDRRAIITFWTPQS